MDNMFSSEVESIEISGIRKFFNKVSKYEDALSLTLGQPDFPVPSKIKQSIIQAINDDKTRYTENAGIPELRDEICKFLSCQNLVYSKDNVIITVGGSEALYISFKALLNRGDKVLIPSIAYPAYNSIVNLMGACAIDYKLNEDFSIDIDSLEKLIKDENPKILVLSFPSNPTGAVINKIDLERLHKIILENDILVISDEIYSSICYEDYYSIASYKDIKDKIILISGFSKMFSMTGLRLGYLCASEKIIKNIIKVHQYNVSCAPSIVQYGVVTGLKYCMDDVDYMRDEFKKRRDLVYERLNAMGLKTNLPKGAFYIFPSIKKYKISSEKFCDKLLEQEKLAVVPGSAFGNGGEGYIRISYCCSEEVLTEALNRLERFIKSC
ncbi:MAG: pyridoxal phosphate-dependent aminotransferase [Clostridiaceae bacterium]